jgi:hypothetical protein
VPATNVFGVINGDFLKPNSGTRTHVGKPREVRRNGHRDLSVAAASLMIGKQDDRLAGSWYLYRASRSRDLNAPATGDTMVETTSSLLA